MNSIFPSPITALPQADLPLDGLRAYLSQDSTHQIVFMEFEKDAQIAEHAHRGQWCAVLDGKAEMTIDGVKHVYTKGDSYFIPEGVKHSAKIFAGYADVTYFDQKDRYSIKK